LLSSSAAEHNNNTTSPPRLCHSQRVKLALQAWHHTFARAVLPCTSGPSAGGQSRQSTASTLEACGSPEHTFSDTLASPHLARTPCSGWISPAQRPAGVRRPAPCARAPTRRPRAARRGRSPPRSSGPADAPQARRPAARARTLHYLGACEHTRAVCMCWMQVFEAQRLVNVRALEHTFWTHAPSTYVSTPPSAGNLAGLHSDKPCCPRRSLPALCLAALGAKQLTCRRSRKPGVARQRAGRDVSRGGAAAPPGTARSRYILPSTLASSSQHEQQ